MASLRRFACRKARPLFWAAHRARLTQAIETLALQLPCPWESIEAQLYALSACLRYGRLKLLTYPGRRGGLHTPYSGDPPLAHRSAPAQKPFLSPQLSPKPHPLSPSAPRRNPLEPL
jgi:hypothetical protein